jgi:hypothetical protein
VGLERDTLRLVCTIEELLERKSSGSGLENQDYCRRGIWCADHATPLYPQKSTLTSQTSVGLPVWFARGLRPRSFLFVHVLCK